MRGLSGFFIVTLVSSVALAEGDGMGDHHGHMCDPDAVATPLLSVGDFNGDGRATGYDLSLAVRKVTDGEYEAIMDRDADGDLDRDDLAITRGELNQPSTTFDQQLALIYQATQRYKNKDNALADGYRPFTQELKGHGQHYARMPFLADPSSPTGMNPDYLNINDATIDIAMPEGLNYDENGQLVAVFYYHGINVLQWIGANRAGDTEAIAMLVQQSMMLSSMPEHLPNAFASDDEMWHQHWGACWNGLDYVAMTFDPSITPEFIQPLTQTQCAHHSAMSQGTAEPKLGWLPAFNMMHVWLYKLNRCGVFAGTHEDVSPHAQPEPFVQSFEDWYMAQFGTMPPTHDGGMH